MDLEERIARLSVALAAESRARMIESNWADDLHEVIRRLLDDPSLAPAVRAALASQDPMAAMEALAAELERKYR